MATPAERIAQLDAIAADPTLTDTERRAQRAAARIACWTDVLPTNLPAVYIFGGYRWTLTRWEVVTTDDGKQWLELWVTVVRTVDSVAMRIVDSTGHVHRSFRFPDPGSLVADPNGTFTRGNGTCRFDPLGMLQVMLTRYAIPMLKV